MIYEFVDTLNGISVGDRVRIKGRYVPPCAYKVVPAPNVFLKYIKKNNNCFIVRTIQQVDDDNAMVGVEEIQGAIEIYQIEKIFGSKKIINSGGEVMESKIIEFDDGSSAKLEMTEKGVVLILQAIHSSVPVKITSMNVLLTKEEIKELADWLIESLGENND